MSHQSHHRTLVLSFSSCDEELSHETRIKKPDKAVEDDEMKPSRHSRRKHSHTTRCWIVSHPFFTCTGKISFVYAKWLPVVWWSYDDEAWQKHAAKKKGLKKATESHLVLNNFSSLSLLIRLLSVARLFSSFSCASKRREDIKHKKISRRRLRIPVEGGPREECG